MPTQFKGTFFFRQREAGWSESLYAVGLGTLNYAQMMTKMKALVPYRCALTLIGSTPPINVKTLNGVSLTHVRVEDENYFKDALTDFIPNNGTGYVPPPSVPNEIFRQNLNPEVAAKIQWNGANPGQQAVSYLHGIPVVAADDDITDPSAWSTLKDAPMSATWLAALQNYAHQIRLQGLGFRFLNSPWDVNGSPGPMAQPVTVTYNATLEVYEFTMPQAALQFKQRYVLRGFKNLNFLNGRWPGIDLGANKIQIRRKARSLVWDGNGFLSPEVWGYFQPNETLPADPTILPGAKFFFLGAKKVGRPFNLPRGRQRVRPT